MTLQDEAAEVRWCEVSCVAWGKYKSVLEMSSFHEVRRDDLEGEVEPEVIDSFPLAARFYIVRAVYGRPWPRSFKVNFSNGVLFVTHFSLGSGRETPGRAALLVACPAELKRVYVAFSSAE